MSKRSTEKRQLRSAGRVIGPADYTAKQKAADKRERRRQRNLATVGTVLKAKP